MILGRLDHLGDDPALLGHAHAAGGALFFERLCRRSVHGHPLIRAGLSKIARHDKGGRRRAAAVDSRISLSTVYRTVNLFEEAGLVTKHDFKDGRARFELIPDEHHDHLIDIRSGKVIEFRNQEIEAIQEVIAKRLGYRLVDHRLELYAVPLSGEKTSK
jgi:transposase